MGGRGWKVEDMKGGEKGGIKKLRRKNVKVKRRIENIDINEIIGKK